MAAAYLNTFDNTSISNNFIGNASYSTGGQGGTSAFSCSVPAGATLLIDVNEVNQNSGTLPFTLTVSGLPCPAPSLALTPIHPAPSVRVNWPTWAGGFELQSTPSLAPPSWSIVTNEPIESNGSFSVTNTAPPPNKFYRLIKP
jgi:hypothetical protein